MNTEPLSNLDLNTIRGVVAKSDVSTLGDVAGLLATIERDRELLRELVDAGELIDRLLYTAAASEYDEAVLARDEIEARARQVLGSWEQS